MDEAQERRAIIRALFAGLAMHAIASRDTPSSGGCGGCGGSGGYHNDAAIVKASFGLADAMLKESGL